MSAYDGFEVFARVVQTSRTSLIHAACCLVSYAGLAVQRQVHSVDYKGDGQFQNGDRISQALCQVNHTSSQDAPLVASGVFLPKHLTFSRIPNPHPLQIPRHLHHPHPTLRHPPESTHHLPPLFPSHPDGSSVSRSWGYDGLRKNFRVCDNRRKTSTLGVRQRTVVVRTMGPRGVG